MHLLEPLPSEQINSGDEDDENEEYKIAIKKFAT